MLVTILICAVDMPIPCSSHPLTFLQMLLLPPSSSFVPPLRVREALLASTFPMVRDPLLTLQNLYDKTPDLNTASFNLITYI